MARLPICVHRALQEQRSRTQRRQAEEELAKKVEELARSNAELEQFAYIASHDLQEPLRIVASYTQLLSEQYRGRLDEKADKYIRYAVDGALRMQGLISDLLAFSKVGHQHLDLKPIACGEIVQFAIMNLEAAIRESGAQINCGDLPIVMGDSTRLTQVFQNLIGNGLKFRGTNPPQIQITAERQSSGSEVDAPVSDWIISVRDNGIGIAPEHHDEIFEVFRRLHTRAEYSGNGIGLAICKKILQQHGGAIWVRSEESEGSIFKLSLPAIADAAANGHQS